MNAGLAQYRIAHIREIVSRHIANRTKGTALRPNESEMQTASTIAGGECAADRGWSKRLR